MSRAEAGKTTWGLATGTPNGEGRLETELSLRGVVVLADKHQK